MSCTLFVHSSAYTSTNLKHIWTRLMAILHVYLTQWLPFFFMPTMLFFSLQQTHVYKGFWTSYMSFALLLAISNTNIVVIARNKRKLNQETFYLGKDQVEITHEYEYPGIDFYSHGHFEPSSKRQRIACMKALMGTLRKESVVGVTSWELKSHLFKMLMLRTFTYGIEIVCVCVGGGGDFKKLSLEGFWEGHEDTYDVPHQSEFLDYLSYSIGRIWRTSHGIICSQAHYELSTMACPPTSSWLVSQATSLSWHLAKQGFNT